MSKTCSRECKTAKDTLARAKKRADKALLKPNKEKNINELYLYWLEYPFYISETYMLKRSRNYETSFDHEKLAQISAARQRGYKRKVNHDGSDKVHVRGLSYKHSYGPIETSRMEQNQINQYFENKYGSNKLKMERFRAELFSRSKKLYI
jgi:hypothetical protein